MPPPRRVSRRGGFVSGVMSSPSFRAVLSPCVGICSLDRAGLCEGCHRTTSEIARWSQMNDDERLHLMEVVLPRREAQRV
jgi:predicted Fe-S protein YdhL (DUF1289 family)